MLSKLVALALCVNLAHGCTFNVEENRGYCDSFEDLASAEHRTKWAKLNLVAHSNSTFTTVKKDSFKDSSQLVDLQVKRIADKLEHGAFDGLSKLFELHLDDNKIREIQGGTFEHLPIENIYIYNCEVKDILPHAFENMPKLRNAWITGNEIQTIRQGVFTDLNLKFLYLRNNKIKQVEAGAFNGMAKLEFLSLEENLLTKFEPHRSIGPCPSLTRLYINRNEISIIKKEMFSEIPNLQILLINLNKIVTLGEGSFQNLQKLWLLDMSHNQIKEIRPDVFLEKDNPIQKLFLHDNKITFLTPEVLARLPNLKSISDAGNPWQCSCQDLFRKWLSKNNVTKICYDEEKTGQRPSCVSHPKISSECVYDLKDSRKVVKYYQNIIKDYPALPPVCNIDGVEKPILGN